MGKSATIMSVWSHPQAMNSPSGFSRHAPVEQKVPIMDSEFLAKSELNSDNKVVCIRGFAGWHVTQLTLERANGEVDQVGQLFHDHVAERNWPIGRVESRLDLEPDEYLTGIEYKSGSYGEHWGTYCRFHTDHGRTLEVKGSKSDVPGSVHSWSSGSGFQITGFQVLHNNKDLPEGRLTGIKTLPYPPPGLFAQDLSRVQALVDSQTAEDQEDPAHLKWPPQVVMRHCCSHSHPEKGSW